MGRRLWQGAVAAGLALAILAIPVFAEKPHAKTAALYSATIRRTAHGIPHITASSFGGLGFGYGYAFAQDNLCVMADMVVTLRGERSRYFGPHAISDDALGPPTANLDSDIYYRGLHTSGLLRRLLARPAPLGPTPQARQLLAGYVAGYNRYLRDTTAARLPDPTCRGKSWVIPITALDVWSVIYNINTLNGSVVYRTAIASATPPTASTRAAARPARPSHRADRSYWMARPPRVARRRRPLAVAVLPLAARGFRV